jgi:hypothetical protein
MRLKVKRKREKAFIVHFELERRRRGGGEEIWKRRKGRTCSR